MTCVMKSVLKRVGSGGEDCDGGEDFDGGIDDEWLGQQGEKVWYSCVRFVALMFAVQSLEYAPHQHTDSDQ